MYLYPFFPCALFSQLVTNKDPEVRPWSLDLNVDYTNLDARLDLDTITPGSPKSNDHL